MGRHLTWAFLVLTLAACASADGPESKVDAGVDGRVGDEADLEEHPVDFAGLDLTGLDFANADFTTPGDMAHVVTGVDPSGSFTPIGSPGDLVGASIDSRQPVLTMHNDRPTIAWIEGTDARVATYNGTAWQLLGGAINGNPGSSAYTVQIASRGGRLHIAFVEKSISGSNNSAYVYTWTGSAWAAVGAPVPMNLSYLGDLALALTSTGTPYVAWTAQASNGSSGPSHVFVSRFDGTNWGAYGSDFGAESPTSSALAAKIVMDAADKLYVTWEESFVHVYTDSGSWTPVGPTMGKLSAGVGSSSFEQEITIDSMGRPIVAWMEYDGSASSIYMQRWSGTAWVTLVTPALSATTGFTNSALSSLTVDGLDAPVVAWVEDSGAPAQSTVFVKRISGGTSTYVGQPLQLTSTYRYLSTPQIAIDSHDIVWLVFTGQQISDSKYRLFVYRYTPT